MKTILLLLCMAMPVYGQDIEIAGVDSIGSYDFKNSSLAKSVVYLGCSGTIVTIGEKVAYGVSAAHCATVGSEFSFDTPDGDSGNARWVKVDKKNDLALFICNADDVKHATPIIDPIPDKAMWLAAGYPSNAGGKQERKLLKYSADMHINGGTIRNRSEFDIREGYIASGDSGGAVFAVRPQAEVEGLVGVTSHRQGSDTLYASNHAALMKFMQECEPEMAADCRDNWCYKWNPKPSPKTPPQVPGPPEEFKGKGQHDLPEWIDSDRERAMIIADLLKRLDETEKKLENSPTLDMDELEKRFAAYEEGVLRQLEAFEKSILDLEKSNAALQSRVELLEAQVQTLEKRPPVPGPAGPQGPKGDKGDDGDQGERGADAELDEDELIKRLIKEFPDRRIILALDGKLIDEEKYRPDEATVLDVRQIRNLLKDE